MSETHGAELSYGWMLTPGFPDIPINCIERPHMLETVVEILSGDTPVVFLEGEEGDGASTTLAQFCQKYPEQTFALFIKPASRFAYSLGYLRQALADQLQLYTYGIAQEEDILDEGKFQSLLLRAQRKNRGRQLFVVVDGLHQIPPEDKVAVAQIFSDLLPVGVDQFRFLITGQQSVLGAFLRGGVKSKPYQQLRFRPEETRANLADAGLDPADCSTVHHLCRGIPGRIAVVRRLLISGVKLEAILESDPSKYLEFVKLEFATLPQMAEHDQLLVAAVAFSKMELAIADLAVLLVRAVDDIERTVADCAILTVSISGAVGFLSETHRKYSSKLLERLRSTTLATQLKYLLENPRSEVSLRFLPTYYETLNQQEALIELLSNEHYCDLLKSTQSFSSLKARAELGAKSAASLKRTHEVFRFSLQRSLFESANECETDSTQIAALVSIGQSETALALASAQPTRLKRLQLLASYARGVRQRTGATAPEVLSAIRQLIAEIEFSELGDDAVNLAADILMFDADAAIGIIESAVKGASKKERDFALTELSFAASTFKLQHKAKVEDKARPLISDEALQRVAHSFELVAEKQDNATIIASLSTMPIARQITFLRAVIGLRATDANVLDLVEFGLDAIIRETEFVPRAKDLAELAYPLAFRVGDRDKVAQLVARFDSQLGLVAKAAHSKYFTLLQLRLAAAEYDRDRTVARDRIEQTYFEVTEIKTPEIRLECLALMLGALTKLDVEGHLEASDGFRAIVKDDLSSLVGSLLEGTSDHLIVALPVVKALAAEDWHAAVDLIERLNTERRRDNAYAAVVQVLAAQPYTEDRFCGLQTTLAKIVHSGLRSTATVEILGALRANAKRAGWLSQVEALRLNILSANGRGKWDVSLLKAAHAAALPCEVKLFIEKIEAIADECESVLDEVQLYFKTAEALAPLDSASARNFYERAVRLKKRTALCTESEVRLSQLCLSLLARAMAPLAQANLLDEDKLSRYFALVEKLPSIVVRVNVLGNLAEVFWCAQRKDLAERIVNEQLRPLLEQARLTGESTFRRATQTAFPAFACSHLTSAFLMLKELEPEDSDAALSEAAYMWLRRLPPSEPDNNGKFDRSKVEVRDVLDVLEILEHIQSDDALNWIIRALVDACNDKVNKARFSNSQKADWSARLSLLVSRKLPYMRNIKHDGYRVTTLAAIYSLTEQPFANWQELEAVAENINNLADKGYVFVCLGISMPSKYATHKKRMLEKALTLFSMIPSPLDRIGHLHGYAHEVFSTDAISSAKEALRQAMRLSVDLENSGSAVRHRRDVIDLADQIDPVLADELIEMIDDDPARTELKRDAKRAIAVTKSRRQLANARQIKDVSDCDFELLPAAAWKNLATLLAGRLEVKSVELTTEYVSLAGKGDVEGAYPVLAWHVENLARKYKSQADISENIAPICEALLLSIELAHVILGQSAANNREPNFEKSADGMLVPQGSRENVIHVIEKWLVDNAIEYIKVSDPYFSQNDIPLLRAFEAHAPSCKVYILASKAFLVKNNALSDDVFRAAWAEQSDQSPPDTEIIALSSADSSRDVIHDRWLISKGAGLRLGTSFASLGGNKLSEISAIELSKLKDVEAKLDQYINRDRIVDGVKIRYTTFTLG